MPSLHTCPRNIAAHLRKLGLHCTLVSDLDLPSRDMSRARLIILPYTNQLSAGALATLKKYVTGGGKIIVFFTLPNDLAGLLGIQPGQYRPAKPAGQFSQIRAADRCALRDARRRASAFLEYRLGQTHRPACRPSPRCRLVAR